MKTGIELIAEERNRQVEKEGWSEGHDNAYYRGELAHAAISYVYAAIAENTPNREYLERSLLTWPWAARWYKPTTAIRDLEKAGALIAAEIDRLQRMNTKAAK